MYMSSHSKVDFAAEMYSTEQEQFWAGNFGDEYIERNNSEQLLISKVANWSRMLRCASGISSMIELGCNVGLNLKALSSLNPALKLRAVEINELAAAQARAMQIADITVGTITAELDLPPADLAFTAGVLIHINPECLPAVYENLVKLSNRYILVCEYYSPNPVSVEYRGHKDRIFKRDFAGELIDGFGLKLVDYGFVYHRDNWAPRDDCNWFLLQK
jgi:pseudaminic acid biosynthesis-associated methylase